MSSKSIRDMTIALAGIFQAAYLVDNLAREGQADSAAKKASLKSLLVLNPENTEAVFDNNISNLDQGLKAISSLLKNAANQSEPLRYSLGILHLERQLRKRNDIQKVIGQRLSDCEALLDSFDLDHENMNARIAGIYTDTISTFKYRIQVTGDYALLQQPRIANQVRALLLAGIRSATLWQQVGGSRIKLLWQRKQLIEAAEALLKESYQ